MVQLRPDEAAAYLASRSGVLGPGWREMDTFDGIDLDEYEDEEVCPPNSLKIRAVIHILRKNM